MRQYNTKDLEIWESLFENVPEEWKAAPPSKAMDACLAFFVDSGVRSVLDVGCGVGRWSIYLAKHGFKVKGADFALRAIAFAEKWAAEEGVPAEFSCRALTEISFPGETFDAAVAALVLDNVSESEMDNGIRHIENSLSEGGLLFALFNPIITEEMMRKKIKCENPTEGITQVSYSDDEIIASFPGFEVLDRQNYEVGMRAFFLKKLS